MPGPDHALAGDGKEHEKRGIFVTSSKKQGPPFGFKELLRWVENAPPNSHALGPQHQTHVETGCLQVKLVKSEVVLESSGPDIRGVAPLSETTHAQ